MKCATAPLLGVRHQESSWMRDFENRFLWGWPRRCIWLQLRSFECRVAKCCHLRPKGPFWIQKMSHLGNWRHLWCFWELKWLLQKSSLMPKSLWSCTIVASSFSNYKSLPLLYARSGSPCTILICGRNFLGFGLLRSICCAENCCPWKYCPCCDSNSRWCCRCFPAWTFVQCWPKFHRPCLFSIQYCQWNCFVKITCLKMANLATVTLSRLWRST